MTAVMDRGEIDEGATYRGYSEALELVLANTPPVGTEEAGLDHCLGRILAEDSVARVNSPSADVSLKDGFAVRSAEVAEASPQRPVHLRVIGSVYAGSEFKGVVHPGTAVRICSGSAIPGGADAVVAGEFCDELPSEVLVKADAEAGRNVLSAGGDAKAGSTVMEKGEVLLPGRVGLLAAGGIEQVKVFRRPKVAIISIGDEVVELGTPLRPGRLYASNLVTLRAWLSFFSIPCDTVVVRDDEDRIRRQLRSHLPRADAVLTTGGAWGSERDLVIRVLEDLGWRESFRRVRMGPGKGVAFGVWKGKAVFCLPGGPPSNETAFLQLALPGILSMAGEGWQPFQVVSAKMTHDLRSRHPAWTEFVRATLSQDSEGNLRVTPRRPKSRLESLARATCLVTVPEGVSVLHRGQVVRVQLLSSRNRMGPDGAASTP
jgi:molybdopterin molybdotransferase